MKDLSEKKSEIEELGLTAIKDYFQVDPTKLDRDFLQHLHSKAKLAMQFEREMNTDKRAVELNYIRVFGLIAVDKGELRDYIKKSMPQYYPVLKGAPKAALKGGE